MNVGIVGYGAIAGKHMEALQEIPGLTPAWLVGRRAEPMAAFVSRWGFERQTLRLEEALADPALDAVVITSPNELHAPQAELALRAGKHVLLEIPAALTLAEVEQLSNLARAVNRHLMVAHTMRFFPAIREIRRRVESGELRVEHFVGEFMMVRRQNITAAGTPRSWTDNLLWHHGAHMVDVILWICGSAGTAGNTDIICRLGPEHPTQGVMNLSISMGLPNGAIATVAQSYGSREFRWRLDVYGVEETLRFDMGQLVDSTGTVLVPRQSVVDLRDQDREFIDSIRENRDPAITVDEILPAMRLLHQAERYAGSLPV